MSAEWPTSYEELTPDAAARVDAVCDRFEQAWKAAQHAGPVPRLAAFLDGCDGADRIVLTAELLALDRACRERYDVAARTDRQEGNGAVSPDADTRLGRRAASLRSAAWPRLPGLELIEVLGSGGMGVVFKARQPKLEREVAIKVLRDAHLGASADRERFLQEARAIARLQHPNLVQLYEFGEVSGFDGAGQPYLVLEYVVGGSLADLLREERLPPHEAARLVERLAEAVHYAHQQGVIHRDLKPANVLLHRDDSRGKNSVIQDLSAIVPKVTDFGLAKFGTGSRLTRTGDVLGTPSYMAPEQAQGKSGVITEAVDVYGLGAILYEALSGRPPFMGDTVAATVRQVQEQEPLPPRRLKSVVPRDLETICMKCLRKEAGCRYATAQDLADDLRRFRTGEPIRARPVSAGERVLGWCRRKPVIAGLLAALFLVLVAGAAGAIWHWQVMTETAAEAQENAIRFKLGQEVARLEKERADRNLAQLQDMVNDLAALGRKLWQHPALHDDALALLNRTLAFYKGLLADETRDPRLEPEAARMYGTVANTYHSIGQWRDAVNAYNEHADILSRLSARDRTDKLYRRLLAVSHRNRGNVLRDLDEREQARAAYDASAAILENLLADGKIDPGDQGALANTLLNKITVLHPIFEAKERARLFRELVKLNRAAVAADASNVGFEAGLALGLEDQGMEFLAAGQVDEALTAVSEALGRHKKIVDSGKMTGYIERYVARNHGDLARVLVAAGKAPEAKQAFDRALTLTGALVDQYPLLPFHRAELAETLASYADFLTELERRDEALKTRGEVIRNYEILNKQFRDDRSKCRLLVLGHLDYVRQLWQLGRQGDAEAHFRKAFEVAPDDPACNDALAWFLATTPELRLRDAEKAVRLAQQAVDYRRKSGDLRNALAVARFRNQDYQAALAEFTSAIQLRGQGSSFDWFFMAMAQARLGHLDEARACFKQAVDWMDEHMPRDRELQRFRAEAQGTPGIAHAAK
jgi:tetratricopeptide (TPR) repeat protein/tRNA A-37 threonylcarbamoyl transferase component Bud32